MLAGGIRDIGLQHVPPARDGMPLLRCGRDGIQTTLHRRTLLNDLVEEPATRYQVPGFTSVTPEIGTWRRAARLHR